MAKKDSSNAEAIRNYLQANPNATPEQVVSALAGIGVTLHHVYGARNKGPAKKSGAKSSTAKKKAALKKAARGNSSPRKKSGARSAVSTNSTESKETKGGRGKNRPYPQRTLEEALTIPSAIKEMNNGRPMDTEQVAKASLNVSKSNTRFFYVAAASRDYSLTLGSRDTEEISLAPLGTEIFFAKDEATKKQKMIDAFMSVDLFKKVYEYYGGSKSIPTTGEFFGNVLTKEFGLEIDFHEEFERIFRANCAFLGIEEGLSALASEKAKSKVKEPPSDDIRVVGAAKGKFDRTAFVIMPFGEKGANPRATGFFEAVLNCIIGPAANTAGFAVETARKKGSDVIHTTILNALLDVDLVIADLTDHNPNVLCELGIRLAIEKPVALIRAKGTERIFDVDLLRIEDYNPNIWPDTVAEDVPTISDHIKATWDNRDTMRPYMEILTGRRRQDNGIRVSIPAGDGS